MTHLTTTGATERQADTAPSKATGEGLAPRGMWWVAWRQHRLVVLIGVGLMLLLSCALLVFRWRYYANVPAGAINCGQNATSGASCQSVWDGISRY